MRNASFGTSTVTLGSAYRHLNAIMLHGTPDFGTVVLFLHCVYAIATLFMSSSPPPRPPPPGINIKSQNSIHQSPPHHSSPWRHLPKLPSTSDQPNARRSVSITAKKKKKKKRPSFPSLPPHPPLSLQKSQTRDVRLIFKV